MKRILKWLPLGLGIWAVHAIWLFNNLDIGQEPTISDVIIVPEGGDGRDLKAVDLLLGGYSKSDHVIVSPLEAEGFNLLPLYLQAGANENQLIAENYATSTYTNAVNTLSIMKERGWTSALVVTSDYHTRRTRMIYERVNQAYGYNLTYIAAYHKVGEQWVDYMATDTLRRMGQAEIYKYYGYLLGLYHVFDLD